MSPREPRDRDDRPSWSEIDKNRNRKSYKPKQESEGQSKKEQAWVKQAALKQANAAFAGAGDPKQDAARKKIFKAEGTALLPAAVDSFIGEFGLPEDWRTLLVALDHPDPDTFKQLALKMLELYKDRKGPDQRAFKTKISILSMAGANSKIQSLAEAVKARIE